MRHPSDRPHRPISSAVGCDSALLEEYPLLPAYHVTGACHLLVWWCHDEQNHLIVARGLPALLRSWEAALRRHGDATPKEYWQAEVVLPTLAMREQHAVERLLDEKECFRLSLVAGAEAILKTRGSLPPLLRRCPRRTANHAACKRCKGDGYVLVGYLDEFFRAHRERWRVFDLFGRPQSAKPRPCFPAAGLVADPARPLFAADCHGGHHNDGIVIRPVEPAGSLYLTPLLLFHGERGEFPLGVRETQERIEELRVASEARRTDLQRKEDGARRARYVDFIESLLVLPGMPELEREAELGATNAGREE